HDLEILREIASGYKSADRFLSDFILEPPDSSINTQTFSPSGKIETPEENMLTLSTIHSAKGLEWDMVIVPHLLEGLFPSFHSIDKFFEIEEERRLFYVACSRAGKEIILTLPLNYHSRGKKLCMPSRYLREIPPELYSYID
ncbi:MAG: 3'-5' exonuclease, partial [bacterium]